MSLVTCPECAHEVSATATACPNCGHPFAPPVIHRKVVVAEAPPERDAFPKWIFIPLGLVGVVLLFVLFAFMRNNDENADGRNINVSVNTQRPAGGAISSNTTTTSIAPESQTVIPPSTTTVVPPSSTTTLPAPAAPPSQTTVTTIPGESSTATAPDKGTVSLEAKIATNSGSIQPVPKESFYLLNKDLESILSDANIEDETGQGLVNAYALSVLYPDRYADTRRKALSAINKHVVYKALTDSGGKASMKDVKPDSYYLFGITKTKTGFAVWSSPVSINAGQNALNLSPARLTEISQ